MDTAQENGHHFLGFRGLGVQVASVVRSAGTPVLPSCSISDMEGFVST